MSSATCQIKNQLQELNKYALVEEDIYYYVPEQEEEGETKENTSKADMRIFISSASYPQHTLFETFERHKMRSMATLWNTISFHSNYKPHTLVHLHEVIEEAKILLTYEYDWDENEGQPTNKETFDRAIDFLLSYGNIIAAKGMSLIPPFIDIMPDGSISLKWETTEAEFFIIFRKDNKEYSYFYGESKSNELPAKIKSGIKTNTDPDDMLLAWMKNYLAK